MSIWSKLGLADAAELSSLRKALAEAQAENERLHREYTQKIEFLLLGYTEECKQGIERIHCSLIDERELVLNAVTSTTENLCRAEQKVCEDIEILGKKSDRISNTVMNESSRAQDLQEKLMQAVIAQGSNFSKHLFSLKEVLCRIEGQEEMLKQILSESKDAIFTVKDMETTATQEQELAFGKLSDLSQDVLDQLEELSLIRGEVKKQNQELNDSLRRIMENQEMTLKMAEVNKDDLPQIKEYMYHLWEAMKLVWINDLIDELD